MLEKVFMHAQSQREFTTKNNNSNKTSKHVHESEAQFFHAACMLNRETKAEAVKTPSRLLFTV